MEKIPDSQWLASLVIAAYSDERYALGLALARLQSCAIRMERAAWSLPAVPVPACCPSCIGRCTGYCSLCHDTVVDASVYEPEHQQHAMCTDCATRHPFGQCPADDAGSHVQALPVDVCQDCGVGIRWSVRLQEWTHIDAEGHPITSPRPAHVGRPPDAINTEAPAPPAEEAPTRVTPSARCTTQLGPAGDCHGVLYWHAYPDGAHGWVHLDPSLRNGHTPVANVPDPE